MRLIPVIALSAALLSAGCTTPDGRFDAGNTLALTAGLAALGGLAYIASQDGGGRNYNAGSYRGGGRQGYGGGYGGGRRGWR